MFMFSMLHVVAQHLNRQMQLIRLPVQCTPPLAPCRPRASVGGYPPSQEAQVCKQCGGPELAANWFPINRGRHSGRSAWCRSGVVKCACVA